MERTYYRKFIVCNCAGATLLEIYPPARGRITLQYCPTCIIVNKSYRIELNSVIEGLQNDPPYYLYLLDKLSEEQLAAVKARHKWGATTPRRQKK